MIRLEDAPCREGPGAEVIPFSRVRGADRDASVPEIVVGDDRSASLPGNRGWPERARPAALILASLVLHGAVFAMAVRERATPLSIGEPSIAIEIVIGADIAAGLAATPSEAEAVQEPAKAAESAETEPPQEVAVTEPVAPDPTREEARAEIAPPREEAPQPVAEEKTDVAAAKPEFEPEPERDPPPVEEPAPAVAVTAPEKTDSPVDRKPDAEPQAKPHTAQTKPEITPPKPAEKKPERAPEKKPEKKPARTAAVSAPASSGVGRGRSDADVNYQGRIVAHLARHKRYPADARARRDEGTAMVRFSINGGGEVTAVAVIRASGFAALDRETEAMVRRASPFPAPPDGRARTFSAPVSFRLE